VVEDIVITVPKSWDDKQKDDFAKRLEELKLADDYRILITNKMDVKFVDAYTMDRMRHEK
jgi:hypothetical protein